MPITASIGKRAHWAVVVSALVLSSSGWSPRAWAGPRFEQHACPFSIAEPVSYRIDCGTVTVPENRARNDGRSVRLSIAIVRAASRHPLADPVVFLDGGPGLRSLDVLTLRMSVNLTVQRIHESRDLIFWDQRGVGYSEPHLCTSLDVDWFRNAELGFTLEEERARNLKTLKSCSADLARLQSDVTQLSTATSAADLEDIRIALGIQSWNLYGASYGTRLGLVALRRATPGIRSALLDGVYPPNAPQPLAQAWRFARVVDLLGKRCAEDPHCAARFPNIAARTYAVIEAAGRQPFSVPIAPRPGLPVDHLVINDRLLALGLYQAFYDTELLPYVPALVEQIEKRNEATFEALAQSLVGSLSYIRQSLNVAVECHDSMAATSAADIEGSNAAEPRLAKAFAGDSNWPAYCDAWQPGRATAEELAPAQSAVPTLLLAGDFDPVTPPAYSELALKSLSHGQIVGLPNAGHGSKAIFPCTLELESAFLAQPDKPLDLACLRHLPNVPFATNVLVLPGLTRLLVGIQSGSHWTVTVAMVAAALLQLALVIAVLVSLLTSHRRHQSTMTAVRVFRGLTLAAGITALATLGVLGVQVTDALGTNPNVLLLGLEAPQSLLIVLACAAGLLAVGVAVWALKYRDLMRRSPLAWLGCAAAVGYVTAALALSGYWP